MYVLTKLLTSIYLFLFTYFYLCIYSFVLTY